MPRLGLPTPYSCTSPRSAARTAEVLPVPAWASEYAEEGLIHISRAKDDGPASKYLGCKDFIRWDDIVFVGDDDQEYHPELFAQMLDRRSGEGHKVILQNYDPDYPCSIAGFMGLMVPGQFVHELATIHLPDECRNVDDDWVSWAAGSLGYEIVRYEGSFSEIYTHAEFNPSADDGLWTTTDRFADQSRCEMALHGHRGVWLGLLSLLAFLGAVLIVVFSKLLRRPSGNVVEQL